MAADREIPPHSTTYMETACGYNEQTIMHAFAYRAHAHAHGIYCRLAFCFVSLFIHFLFTAPLVLIIDLKTFLTFFVRFSRS